MIQSYRFFLASFIYVVTFAVYLYGLMPSIGGGDNAELITAGYTYGIAHAPGYPLYVIMGKLFCILFPFGNPAYAMNLFSAAMAALTVMICYAVLSSYIKDMVMPLVFSLFLAFLPGFWLGAYQAEVFALNGLCAIGIIGIMIRQNKPADRIPDRLVMLLFGLSLGNQHTLLLLAPAVFIWEARRLYCLRIHKSVKLYVNEILILSGFFVIGISIYAFLPIRSSVQPLLDWEDPETWSKFWYVISRSRYGSLQLAQGTPDPLSLTDIFIQIKFFGSLLVQDIGRIGMIILLGGIGVSLYNYKKIENTIILTAFGVTGLGIFLLANVKPGETTIYIMSRFMLLPLIMSVLLIAQFCDTILKKASKRTVLLIGLLCALLIPGRIIASLTKDVVRRDDFFVRDFGKNVLKHLPRKTLLFSDRADELEFSMAYFLYALRYRSDITFIDCNAGVSRSIYGPRYYGIWGKPRLAIREKIEREWIKKSLNPVFYGTNDVHMVAIPRVSEGFLFRVAADRALSRALPWDALLIRERGYRERDRRQKHLRMNTNSLLAQYFIDNKLASSADNAIRLLRAYGGDKSWRLISAYWYYERKLFDEAERSYTALIKDYPDDIQGYINIGVLYNDQRRFSEAEDMFKKAIELDDSYVQAHYNLAVTYWLMERWEDSAQQFTRVLQYEPSHADAEKFYRRALDKQKR